MKKLYAIILAIFIIISCESPSSYNLETFEDKDVYVVEGYVTRNDLSIQGQSVWLYIKDYNYQMYQTTFECKTEFTGKYRFIVDYIDWNYYYYNLYCNGKFEYGRIVFGTVDQVDFTSQ